MKILCDYTASGPSFVRTGWKRVFEALGHTFRFWDAENDSAFDVWAEYSPDIYLGTTYNCSRAITKNIVLNPQTKVALFASAWGPYLKDVDPQKYPLVVTTEQEKRTIETLRKATGKPDFVFIHAHDRWLEGTMSGWAEIGVPYLGILNGADVFVYLNGGKRPEFECDAAYVGGRWPFKARNIDKMLLPLCHPSKKLRIKIFGNTDWPVHQYLGPIDERDVADLFASATVCPNVSEPHSTNLGHDCVERIFKVPASGGFAVSDYVEEAYDLFGEMLPMAKTKQEYEDMIRYYVDQPEKRESKMKGMTAEVLANHTYFNRVAQMLVGFGMADEAKRAISLKVKMLEGHL